MKIYVVMGTKGEYSDRTEWAVVAFDDEEKAKEQVVLATERSREIAALAEIETSLQGTGDLVDVIENDLDPAAGIMENLDLWCYRPVSYFYYEVDLITQSWLKGEVK